MDDLLVVYNTFGQKDNAEHYIKCLLSIVNNKISSKFKLAWSSCLNKNEHRNKVIKACSPFIDFYCFIDKPLPVNITFNKAVREAVKKFGNFKYYLYVDSGVDFLGNQGAIEAALSVLNTEQKYAILSFQIANDHALYNVGITNPPLIGKNHEVPLGSACNGHAEIFSDDLYRAFNNKIIPDVFAAFCTESVYSFLAAAVNKKWVILGDYLLNHAKSVDGASSSMPHASPVFHNPWNNLLCGRNALDFINDKEAIEVGLGYEECNQIMLHKKEAYTEDGFPKYKNELATMINKYFFLSKTEFNYENI